MESMHEGGELHQSNQDARASGARLVEALAGALREEFGVAIDAHPGGNGTEAGAVNRAFRAAVSVVLGEAVSPGDDPAAVRTWVLRRTALRRLEELGVSGAQAEALLIMEAKLGDRWLAYLTLAPVTVVDDIKGRTPGG